MASSRKTIAKTRVAIVEDDERLRNHFVRTIDKALGLELCWVAGSIKQAKEHFDDIPDVALVDLGLPDGNGSELISALQKQASVKVLVITIFDDKQSVIKAVNSGADGYIVKESNDQEIVESIEALMDGGSPISASAAIHLMGMVRENSEANQSELEEADIQLTPRQSELLELFAKGLTYREAAESLGISRHTVGDHMKSIYRKLAVSSRSEAVFEAVHHKLIKFE